MILLIDVSHNIIMENYKKSIFVIEKFSSEINSLKCNCTLEIYDHNNDHYSNFLLKIIYKNINKINILLHSFCDYILGYKIIFNPDLTPSFKKHDLILWNYENNEESYKNLVQKIKLILKINSDVASSSHFFELDNNVRPKFLEHQKVINNLLKFHFVINNSYSSDNHCYFRLFNGNIIKLVEFVEKVNDNNHKLFLFSQNFKVILDYSNFNEILLWLSAFCSTLNKLIILSNEMITIRNCNLLKKSNNFDYFLLDYGDYVKLVKLEIKDYEFDIIELIDYDENFIKLDNVNQEN